MSLINIEKTIELDVYDHDTTPSVIKTIQMDTGTRTVFAVIQNSRQDYDIGQNASVSLTVLRPDKTKVQVTGQTFVCYTGSDGNMYGAKAELSDVALAVKGNLKAQFKITSGEQELRTEIFTISNGEALDVADGDWAGDLDGHNLDEMAQDIEDAKAAVSEMETDVSELKEGLSSITSAIVKSYADIAPYLHKRNVYYKNGVETTLSGYDTYFIPLNVCDICAIHYDISDTFYAGLNEANVFSTVDAQNAITACVKNSNKPDYYFSSTTTPGIFNAIGTTNTTGVYVTVKNGLESKLEFYLNEKYTILKDYPFKTAINVEENDRYISDRIYYTGGVLRRFAIGYHSTKIKVKAGDKFTFSGSATGINQYGILRKESGCENITSHDYTVSADGVAFVYNNDAKDITVYYYPVDAVTISAGQIIGTINANNQFNGLSGVAFGTSLTYRAQTTHGYLQYLPDLCGMTIENQGIGSSEILGNMLIAIKAYTSYANKDVAILEGFVNDWYNANALGNYDDTEETTVCGCVRSALNYMMSQNANLTIFLVLDPYGKVNGDVDCSSDAIRGGVTQKEYYDEIAKVGESLGIPVIKQYAISQISENTPQYIADNIHPTQLGAKQSAYAIWSQMRQYFPNQK